MSTARLLMTDFVSLKIKPTQSFKCAHRSRVCVFIGMTALTCMGICIYTVFLKKYFIYFIMIYFITE
jgi:hypothetical protein